MKKASFRHDERNAAIQSIEGKSAVLLISVGQPYHEAESLSAVINLINRAHFSFCTIVLADTLQRHNYCLDHSPAETYELAVENGYAWRARNSEILKACDVENHVITWDTWLAHTFYPSLKKKIDLMYSSNQHYKDAIDKTYDLFALRVMKRQHDANWDHSRFNTLYLEYIKEECAIIMPLWASMGYDYIIYPKLMTSAMESTYKLLIEEQSKKVQCGCLYVLSMPVKNVINRQFDKAQARPYLAI